MAAGLPSKMEVQVKLCGFCNPMFDPADILEKLKEVSPRHTFRYCSDVELADLVLNGCQSACVQQDAGKAVIVAGFSVNGNPVEGFGQMLAEACHFLAGCFP